MKLCAMCFLVHHCWRGVCFLGQSLRSSQFALVLLSITYRPHVVSSCHVAGLTWSNVNTYIYVPPVEILLKEVHVFEVGQLSAMSRTPAARRRTQGGYARVIDMYFSFCGTKICLSRNRIKAKKRGDAVRCVTAPSPTTSVTCFTVTPAWLVTPRKSQRPSSYFGVFLSYLATDDLTYHLVLFSSSLYIPAHAGRVLRTALSLSSGAPDRGAATRVLK